MLAGQVGRRLLLESKVVISFLSLARVWWSGSDTDIVGKSFKQFLLFWMRAVLT